MYVPTEMANVNLSAREIVMANYRAARVLLKYDIQYCCGAKFSLKDVCESRGLEPEKIVAEILKETREVRLPGNPGYEDWPLGFLIDYIINVHHRYLRNMLPELSVQLTEFLKEHEKGNPGLKQLSSQFSQLSNEMMMLIRTEEEIIFPYIRQVLHAYQNRESYGKLLVRTLRKPVTLIQDLQLRIEFLLEDLKSRTNNFTPPGKSCISHQVIFARLKELNEDIEQHSHLEKGLLYPQLTQLESKLDQMYPH